MQKTETWYKAEGDCPAEDFELASYLLFEAGLFFARKYRNAPTMKELRDARDIASFDVFAPNGGSKKIEESEKAKEADNRQGGEK